MTDANRLENLSAVQSVPPQTQKRDFGAVVSNALGTVAQGGASLLTGVAGAVPLLSAALPGIQSVKGLTATPMASTSSSSVAGTGMLGSTTTSSSGTGSVEQMLSQTGGQDLSNTQLLMLQQQINQESQQYTTLSNVLKVRSDSAKSAINNIR